MMPRKKTTCKSRSKRSDFKVMLNGADVTPKSLKYEVVQPVHAVERTVHTFKEVKTPSPVTESSSETLSSFHFGLSSPIDLECLEEPYSESTLGHFLEHFQTPPLRGDKEKPIILRSKATGTRFIKKTELPPLRIKLSLKETPTFFLLERPSLTEECGSEEGLIIEKDNEYYEYMTVGDGRKRHTKNIETQAEWIIPKEKEIQVDTCNKKDSEVLATTYDLYHSFLTET